MSPKARVLELEISSSLTSNPASFSTNHDKDLIGTCGDLRGRVRRGSYDIRVVVEFYLVADFGPGEG